MGSIKYQYSACRPQGLVRPVKTSQTYHSSTGRNASKYTAHREANCTRNIPQDCGFEDRKDKKHSLESWATLSRADWARFDWWASRERLWRLRHRIYIAGKRICYGRLSNAWDFWCIVRSMCAGMAGFSVVFARLRCRSCRSRPCSSPNPHSFASCFC